MVSNVNRRHRPLLLVNPSLAEPPMKSRVVQWVVDFIIKIGHSRQAYVIRGGQRIFTLCLWFSSSATYLIKAARNDHNTHYNQKSNLKEVDRFVLNK